MFGHYTPDTGRGDATYLITDAPRGLEGGLTRCYAVHVGPEVFQPYFNNLRIDDNLDIDVDPTPVVNSKNPFESVDHRRCDILEDGTYEMKRFHKYDGTATLRLTSAGIAAVTILIGLASYAIGSRVLKRKNKEGSESPPEKS